MTGANSGIGRGVAIALGQAGADVMVNYVDGDDAAEAVVDEIRAAGSDALRHQGRCVLREQVAAMFARDDRSASAPSTFWSTTPACSATRRSRT